MLKVCRPLLSILAQVLKFLSSSPVEFPPPTISASCKNAQSEPKRELQTVASELQACILRLLSAMEDLADSCHYNIQEMLIALAGQAFVSSDLGRYSGELTRCVAFTAFWVKWLSGSMPTLLHASTPSAGNRPSERVLTGQGVCLRFKAAFSAALIKAAHESDRSDADAAASKVAEEILQSLFRGCQAYPPLAICGLRGVATHAAGGLGSGSRTNTLQRLLSIFLAPGKTSKHAYHAWRLDVLVQGGNAVIVGTNPGAGPYVPFLVWWLQLQHATGYGTKADTRSCVQIVIDAFQLSEKSHTFSKEVQRAWLLQLQLLLRAGAAASDAVTQPLGTTAAHVDVQQQLHLLKVLEDLMHGLYQAPSAAVLTHHATAAAHSPELLSLLHTLGLVAANGSKKARAAAIRLWVVCVSTHMCSHVTASTTSEGLELASAIQASLASCCSQEDFSSNVFDALAAEATTGNANAACTSTVISVCVSWCLLALPCSPQTTHSLVCLVQQACANVKSTLSGGSDKLKGEAHTLQAAATILNVATGFGGEVAPAVSGLNSKRAMATLVEVALGGADRPQIKVQHLLDTCVHGSTMQGYKLSSLKFAAALISRGESDAIDRQGDLVEGAAFASGKRILLPANPSTAYIRALLQMSQEVLTATAADMALYEAALELVCACAWHCLGDCTSETPKTFSLQQLQAQVLQTLEAALASTVLNLQSSGFTPVAVWQFFGEVAALRDAFISKVQLEAASGNSNHGSEFGVTLQFIALFSAVLATPSPTIHPSGLQATCAVAAAALGAVQRVMSRQAAAALRTEQHSAPIGSDIEAQSESLDGSAPQNTATQQLLQTAVDSAMVAVLKEAPMREVAQATLACIVANSDHVHLPGIREYVAFVLHLERVCGGPESAAEAMALCRQVAAAGEARQGAAALLNVHTDPSKLHNRPSACACLDAVTALAHAYGQFHRLLPQGGSGQSTRHTSTYGVVPMQHKALVNVQQALAAAQLTRRRSAPAAATSAKRGRRK